MGAEKPAKPLARHNGAGVRGGVSGGGETGCVARDSDERAADGGAAVPALRATARPDERLAILIPPLQEPIAVGYQREDVSFVEIGSLSMLQKRARSRLFGGLDADGARLANALRVNSRPDAIRWILEQIGLLPS